MTKSARESEFSTLAQSFQQGPCWEMDVMQKVKFALSSNKDQLRDYHNFLNQKVITAINT